MQTKLTLRPEDSLIVRAKEHARRSGRSVSQLVADLFVGQHCPQHCPCHVSRSFEVAQGSPGS